MKRIILTILVIVPLFAGAQTGQWDSTQVIIYPTDTTLKIPLSVTDTIYGYNVLPSDSGKYYINLHSNIELVYDFNQDAIDDTLATRNIIYGNFEGDSLLYLRNENFVLNQDSTINLPSRLTEIEVYSSATDRMSYFNIVPLSINAKWVDPINGNNGNSGSYDSPYLTTEYVSTITLSNDTVYVKTGLEKNSNFFIHNDTYKYFAIGDYKLISTSATFIASVSGVGAEIHGFDMDGESATSIGVRFSGTNQKLKNSRLSNITSRAIEFTGGNGCVTESNTFINNQANIDIRINNYTYKGIENFANNNTEHLSPTITDNSNLSEKWLKKINGWIFTLINSNEITIKYSDITGYVNSHSNATDSGLVIFEGNTVKAIADIPLIGVANIASINIKYKWIIKDNYFNYDTFQNTAIQLFNQDSVIIDGNLFDGIGTGAIEALTVDNRLGADTLKSCVVKNNEIHIRGDQGSDLYVIQIGNQSIDGSDELIKGAIVENNKIIGSGFYTGTPSTHGIFITRSQDATVRYNYCEGVGLGLVFKGVPFDQNALCSYNILKNCKTGIDIKGYDSLKVYGNTIYNDSTYSSFGISVILNPSEFDSTSNNCDIRNNIIYDASPSGTYDVIYLEDGTTGTVSNYNVFLTDNNILASNGIVDYTFPQWQSLGYDANSFNTDPNLKSTTELWPVSPSDAIGNGDILSSTYNTGLDTTSVWTDDVVTTTQKSLWSIGSYVVSITSDLRDTILVGVDTTLTMWSLKVNSAIYEYNTRTTSSLDTLETNRVEGFDAWYYKGNQLIKAFPAIQNDTSEYGVDNLDVFRTNTNAAIDLESKTD